jgi:hypothetical protein
MGDERTVYERLRKLMGEIDQEAWEYLVDERAVEAVAEGDEDLNWLADKYRRLLAIGSHPVPPPRPAPQMLEPTEPPPGPTAEKRPTRDLRFATLSRLVARDAAHNEEVVAFRRQILNGAPVPPEQVEDWIRQQAAADGPATLVLSGVPAPTTCRVAWTGDGYAIEPPMIVSLAPEGMNLYLHYGVPNDPALRMQMVALDGTLDRLRRLSDGLANWYGWQSGQATLFVLTGWIPSIQAAEASVHYRRLPALTRLELSLDPTLTPHEVAELYRRARRNTLGRRYRSLSEKHLQLAAFGGEVRDTPVEERMHAWNARYPEWRYTEPSNFSRDCAQARKRVLYPPLANDPFARWLKGGPAPIEVVES